MGFSLVATTGTATHLRTHGIPVSTVYKVHEGRPNCLDMILNGGVQLLVNTPLGKHAQRDDYTMRQAAIRNHVAYTTTLSAARAAADAILSLKSQPATVRSLQEWQQDIVRPEPVGT
jgi:carbamoyl-phosphate synthase large subunit